MNTANIVICGAGIAGVATAYHLARAGMSEIVLVEQGDPLALTSDKSTECYRNWWPDGAMVALMNRSIDLIEELASASANRILLNRRGYLYATADPARVAEFVRSGEIAASHGAGALRIHRSAQSYQPHDAHAYLDQLDGADLITDQAAIRTLFPYLNEQTVAVLHARRAGWFSAQQLGMLLLEQAREQGVRLVRGRVTAVDTTGGQVRSVLVEGRQGSTTIYTPCFVNTAGPLLGPVGTLLGVELPIFSELHLKASIDDRLAAVPRNAPMLIWADPIDLEWDEDEREALADDAAMRYLLEQMPAGAHGRPEGEGGSSQLLLLWDYHSHAVEPYIPAPIDPDFPEIALRGLATMLPGLRLYRGRLPRPWVDGGYYTKTRENRPLIGPLPVEGAYVLGALSGYGLMAACAAAELLAAYILGSALPGYAAAFHPDRYANPAYLAEIAAIGASGQL
jgi:glycine/D-amino acid oxidase-like deaminating enzyme